ncbi:MAG: hypothetical protein RH942_00170 [Kiloniellaceae bacterium]
MFPKLLKVPSIAAVAVAALTMTAAGPSAAGDWRHSVERHYSAAKAAKYTPRGDNPRWDFDLETVVNDMEWRARTAAMLRDLPKPGARDRDAPSSQLADRPERRRLPFRF